MGARQFERIRTVVKQVCGLSEATAVVIAIVLLVLGKYILSFYVTDEAVVYAMGNLEGCTVRAYCSCILCMP
ncbi:MAG: MATE family efflux transporter [Enterocloster bolteae]